MSEAAQETPNATTETTTAETLYPEKVEIKAETKAEVKAEEKAAPVEEKKAEEVKLELKVPENSPLSKEAVEKIQSFAKEKGLSNEQAQAILERDIEAQQQQAEFVQQKTTEWFETSKSDKEIGGENFAKNAELAKRVVDRFASQELKQDLEATGFGNHPELLRLLVRIGQKMAPDSLVLPGSSVTKREKSMEETFYGSTNE
jgi:hypothetical protein